MRVRVRGGCARCGDLRKNKDTPLEHKTLSKKHVHSMLRVRGNWIMESWQFERLVTSLHETRLTTSYRSIE